MKVLLSIKPEFAELIFEGKKKFEFRRTIFKKDNVKTIVVYASSPIQKVIGEFEIEDILNEQLSYLWKKTKKHAGIQEEYFYQYFGDKSNGYAIKIKNAMRYKKPLSLKDNFNVFPPQSFLYLNNA
jgi:predicted transcriptional regulator